MRVVKWLKKVWEPMISIKTFAWKAQNFKSYQAVLVGNLWTPLRQQFPSTILSRLFNSMKIVAAFQPVDAANSRPSFVRGPKTSRLPDIARPFSVWRRKYPILEVVSIYWFHKTVMDAHNHIADGERSSMSIPHAVMNIDRPGKVG